jgi:hypothetical protein
MMTDKLALKEVVDGYRELIKTLPAPRPIIVTGQQSKSVGPPHLPQVEKDDFIFFDYPTNILQD